MKIETFYAGGGIWLSQYDAGRGHYAVVSNEQPDYLSIYRKTDDEDELYLPETMISSKPYKELGQSQKAIHDILKAGLAKVGAI